MSLDLLKMYSEGLGSLSNAVLESVNAQLTTWKIMVIPGYIGFASLPAEWSTPALDALNYEDGLALMKLVNVPGAKVELRATKGRPTKRGGGSHTV